MKTKTCDYCKKDFETKYQAKRCSKVCTLKFYVTTKGLVMTKRYNKDLWKAHKSELTKEELEKGNQHDVDNGLVTLKSTSSKSIQGQSKRHTETR